MKVFVEAPKKVDKVDGYSLTKNDLTDALKDSINNNSDKISDVHYVHNQPLPSTIWSIAHNLEKYPSIKVVDTSGTVVMGNEQYIDTNNIVLTFSAAFAGKAYLN